MLKILHNIRDADYNQITCVYQETINTIGSERVFYDDWCTFFQYRSAFLAVWESEGRYISCVRGELYRDGVLLSCLETVPDQRRMGYALLMLKALIFELRNATALPIYVHVDNKNKASLGLHKKLGFKKYFDYARLVDGTVTSQFCTMKYE